MRKGTLIALVLVILMTVIIMQNQDNTNFNLIVVSGSLPKMVMMTAMSIGGLLVGILVMSRNSSDDKIAEGTDDFNTLEKRHSNTLSDEDRDYISEP